MRCVECERWISDSLAGALSEKKWKRLQAHVRECPSCREFERSARLIQEEAPASAALGRPQMDWTAFESRLKRRLASESKDGERRFRPGLRWKWILAAAPLILAAAGGLFLLLRPGAEKDAQFYLAADERLHLITYELADDPELEGAFNRLLESSLGEDLAAVENIKQAWPENPLYGHDVSDEEMTFVLEELKKELKS